MESDWNESDLSSGPAVSVGGGVAEKLDDGVSRQSVRQNVDKPARVRVVYAVAVGLLLALVGLIFLLSRPGQMRQIPTREEAKQQVTKESGAPQTKVDPLKEKGTPGVPPLATTEPTLSEGAGQGSDSSAREEEPRVPEAVRTSKEKSVRGARTETQKRVGSKTSVESGREAFTDSLREGRGSYEKEKSPDDRGTPASENRRGMVGQDPGTITRRSPQDTSSKGAAGVEPDKVIDWLLEKRSEKK